MGAWINGQWVERASRTSVPKPTLRSFWGGRSSGSNAGYAQYVDALRQWQGSSSGQAAKTAAAAGAGSASSGGIPSPYKEILDRAQAEQDTANAANDARYNQALGLSDTMLQTSQGMGEQERADIQGQFANTYAKQLQSVVSSGLSNSMLKPALMASQAKNTMAAEGRLNDRLKSTQLDILRNKQGVITSKVDEGPNQGLYAQLIKSLGEGGLGSSGFRFGSAGAGGGGDSGGGSLTRARPWSPNWNMNQGMSYQAAMKTAGAATPWYPGGGNPTTYKKKTGFWDAANKLAAAPMAWPR